MSQTKNSNGSFPQPVSSRAVKIGPISISVLLHAAMLTVIGGVVIIEQVVPKTNFSPVVLGETIQDQVVDANEVVDEIVDPGGGGMLEVPADEVAMPESSMSVESVDALSVESALPSSWTLSSAASLGTAGMGSGLGTGSGSGGGASGGVGTGKGKTIGRLFGKQVEAQKLGVILDISMSAHDKLPAAVQEIQRSFRNMPLVMAFGCGINPQAVDKDDSARIYRFADKKPHPEQDSATGGNKKGPSRTTLGMIAAAELKNPEVRQIMETLRSDPNAYILYSKSISVTQLAFEKLIEEGCDTIYWFADFADAVDPKEMEKLTRELKRREIKVIAHNFSGKAVPALQTQMARETGGDTLSKVPGS
ncbi:MAG: hypothetical protein HC904_02285 [Blastochloris sp.]|nr:hypothetical protein [Blastochloris sp.]